MRYVSRAGTLWKETTCKLARYRPCLVSSRATLGTWHMNSLGLRCGGGRQVSSLFVQLKANSFFLPRVLYLQKKRKKQLQVGMKIWPKVLKDKWKHAIFLYFINTASHIEWVPMTARDVSLSICFTQPTQNIGIGPVGKFSTW